MVLTKEQMKQYRLDNKDKIAKQRAEYYQDNKDEIQTKQANSEKQQATKRDYAAKKFTCDCGVEMRNSSKGAHRKVCKARAMLELRKSYHSDEVKVEGREASGT